MDQFSLFHTEVGSCAIAWGAAGIRSVLLTKLRLLRLEGWPGAARDVSVPANLALPF